MMSTRFPNLTGQAGTYNTTGPVIDLSGAAPADHRTFAQALTDGDLVDGDTVFVVIKKDATNLLVWEATWNDLGTDTIARVTEITSVGTIGGTDAVEVFVINPSHAVTGAYHAAKKLIIGAKVINTDIDTVQLGPGACMVNGEWLKWTSNISSGNLLTSEPGRSADGLWYGYLYNKAGIPDVEYSQTVPVQSADKTHWHKTGDTSRRFVRKHTVHTPIATREIMDNFYSNSEGNIVFEANNNYPAGANNPVRVVDDSTPLPTTMTAMGTTAGGSFDPDDIIPVTGIELEIGVSLIMQSLGGSNYWGCLFAIDSTSTVGVFYAAVTSRIHTTTDGGLDNMFLPNVTFYCDEDPVSLYYGNSELDGTTRTIIDIKGVKYER